MNNSFVLGSPRTGGVVRALFKFFKCQLVFLRPIEGIILSQLVEGDRGLSEIFNKVTMIIDQSQELLNFPSVLRANLAQSGCQYQITLFLLHSRLFQES